MNFEDKVRRSSSDADEISVHQFANDIVELRQKLLRWSQKRLSKEADIPRSTLRDIESGKYISMNNRIKLLFTVANALKPSDISQTSRSVSDHTRRTIKNISRMRNMTKDNVGEIPALLGMCIRRLREEQGLTVKELAAQVGISTGTLSYLERGIGSGNIEHINRLSKVLNVDLASIPISELRKLSELNDDEP